MLDPVVCVIVSLFIVKVAVDIALPVIRELLETSLPQHIEDEIVEVIMSDPSVMNVHKLRTRKVGDSYAIDLHIVLSGISRSSRPTISPHVPNNVSTNATAIIPI